MSFIDPPLALRFYYQPGCAACASAEPHLKEFQRKHRRMLVTMFNLSVIDYAVGDWRPNATPAYALVTVSGQLVDKFVGVLTLDELEQFVSGTLPEPERKKRA